MAKPTTERKVLPGYVLVEMVMDDDTWHLMKSTTKVTDGWRQRSSGTHFRV